MLMTRSLLLLGKLSRATDFSTRYRLMQLTGDLELPGDIQVAYPRLIWYSLPMSIRTGCVDYEGFAANETPLGQYTPAENARFVDSQGPFVADPDGGPMRAWRWACQNQIRDHFGGRAIRESLFLRGYCFWDQARLDQWSLLQQPWPHMANPNGPWFEALDANVKKSEKPMSDSWKAREVAYRKGERGRYTGPVQVHPVAWDAWKVIPCEI